MALKFCKRTDLGADTFDALVVGCGFAGAVIARELAERGNMSVAIIEKRSHIGGNMYDEIDSQGVLVHRFGPHIFHTNNERAFEYIRRFTDWIDYEHRVLADWHGTYFPVPFNKTSMKIAFGEQRAEELIKLLVETFGDERKVTINELRLSDNADLKELADFVYNNVFLHYTQKQWGLTPDEVDPSVTARVPVFVSSDDRYFQDAFQGMPAQGYTKLFENILDHPHISLCLNTEAENVFDLQFASLEEDAPVECILVGDAPFDGPIVFTGPLDELFLSRFGRLPYRTLDFVYESFDEEYVLPCGTVNYTVSEDFTRKTEFKHLTGQKCPKTTVMKEYSKPYEDIETQIPYYAIINERNEAHYQKYRSLVKPLSNFYVLGRLAEYRYYNMDVIIAKALEMADEIIG